MKKVIFGVLCIMMLVSLLGVSLATNGTLHTMQDEERMMLDGKDVFACSSGELYTLWKSSEIPEGASIGYIGYVGDGMEDEVPGLHFPFVGFDIMTYSDGADAKENRERLISMPLEETQYSVSYVSITEPGIAGPFGIEIGMTVGTLRSLLPELTEEALDVEKDGYDMMYTARYQNSADSATYSIKVYSLYDMVSYCIVSRD